MTSSQSAHTLESTWTTSSALQDCTVSKANGSSSSSFAATGAAPIQGVNASPPTGSSSYEDAFPAGAPLKSSSENSASSCACSSSPSTVPLVDAQQRYRAVFTTVAIAAVALTTGFSIAVKVYRQRTHKRHVADAAVGTSTTGAVCGGVGRTGSTSPTATLPMGISPVTPPPHSHSSEETGVHADGHPHLHRFICPYDRERIEREGLPGGAHGYCRVYGLLRTRQAPPSENEDSEGAIKALDEASMRAVEEYLCGGGGVPDTLFPVPEFTSSSCSSAAPPHLLMMPTAAHHNALRGLHAEDVNSTCASGAPLFCENTHSFLLTDSTSARTSMITARSYDTLGIEFAPGMSTTNTAIATSKASTSTTDTTADSSAGTGVAQEDLQPAGAPPPFASHPSLQPSTTTTDEETSPFPSEAAADEGQAFVNGSNPTYPVGHEPVEEEGEGIAETDEVVVTTSASVERRTGDHSSAPVMTTQLSGLEGPFTDSDPLHLRAAPRCSSPVTSPPSQSPPAPVPTVELSSTPTLTAATALPSPSSSPAVATTASVHNPRREFTATMSTSPSRCTSPRRRRGVTIAEQLQLLENRRERQWRQTQALLCESADPAALALYLQYHNPLLRRNANVVSDITAEVQHRGRSGQPSLPVNLSVEQLFLSQTPPPCVHTSTESQASTSQPHGPQSHHRHHHDHHDHTHHNHHHHSRLQPSPQGNEVEGPCGEVGCPGSTRCGASLLTDTAAAPSSSHHRSSSAGSPVMGRPHRDFFYVDRFPAPDHATPLPLKAMLATASSSSRALLSTSPQRTSPSHTAARSPHRTHRSPHAPKTTSPSPPATATPTTTASSSSSAPAVQLPETSPSMAAAEGHVSSTSAVAAAAAAAQQTSQDRRVDDLRVQHRDGTSSYSISLTYHDAATGVSRTIDAQALPPLLFPRRERATPSPAAAATSTTLPSAGVPVLSASPSSSSASPSAIAGHGGGGGERIDGSGAMPRRSSRTSMGVSGGSGIHHLSAAVAAAAAANSPESRGLQSVSTPTSSQEFTERTSSLKKGSTPQVRRRLEEDDTKPERGRGAGLAVQRNGHLSQGTLRATLSPTSGDAPGVLLRKSTSAASQNMFVVPASPSAETSGGGASLRSPLRRKGVSDDDEEEDGEGGEDPARRDEDRSRGRHSRSPRLTQLARTSPAPRGRVQLQRPLGAPLPPIEPVSGGPRLQGVAGQRGEMVIGAFLGGGACGKVYECLNTETGEILAVKQIAFDSKDPKLRQRLKQLELELEVLTLAAQHHVQWIVGYHGAEKLGHSVLMYLEYCEHGSLLDYMAGGNSEDAAVWGGGAAGLPPAPHPSVEVHAPMSAGPPRSVSPSGEVVDMSGAASFAKNGAALPSSSDENGECSPSEEAGFTTSSPAEVTLPPSCSLPSSSSVPAAHESSGVPMASTVGQKCHDSPIASPPPPPVAAGDEPVASSCVSTHDRTCSSLSSAPSSSNSDEEEDEEGDKGICPAGGTHRRQHPTTPPPPPLPPRQQHSEQPSERVSEYTSGDHHRSEVANPPSDTAPPCPQGHRHHHHHHHHRHHTASSQRSTSVLSGGAGSVDSLETMTLSEAMRPQMPPLSIEEVQRFARHLVLGLHFLHRHHYAHLDVKTANVLITASEECRLADLGCAMRLQPPPSPEDREAEGGAADSPAAAPYPVLLNHEEITELRGTALYMAPEMIRFERHCIGSPGDIWSLGCVLMEMATGCAPWRHIARDKLRVLFRIGSARTELPLPPLMRAWSEEAREWLAEAELLETEETGSTATYDDDDDGDNHHPHGVRVEEGPHAGEGKDEGEIYEDCNGNASHQPRHSAFGNAEADEDSGGHPDEPPRRERRLELCASPQRRSTSPLHSYHTSRAPKTAATAGASVPCGTIPITPGGASASFIANHADWLNATMACPPSSLSAAGATSYNGAVGTATSASAIAPVPAAWSRCCETAGGAQTPNHATASSTKEADQANVGNEESEAALPSTACRHARDEESDAPAATIDVPVAASPVHEEGRPGEEETAAAGGGGDNVDEMDDNGDGELDQYTSVARYVAHQRRLMELYVQLEDFVGCCLRIRPEERSTAEQLLNHPFLTL